MLGGGWTEKRGPGSGAADSVVVALSGPLALGMGCGGDDDSGSPGTATADASTPDASVANDASGAADASGGSDARASSDGASGAETAWAGMKFSRLKKDGEALPPKDRASSYTLKKFPDGWRITKVGAGTLTCAAEPGESWKWCYVDELMMVRPARIAPAAPAPA